MAPSASRLRPACIEALNQMTSIRGKNAHSNKYTCLFEFIDNATSPSVHAKTVYIDTGSVRPQSHRTDKRMSKGTLLRVKDDGTGIKSLSKAFTLAGSSKLTPQDNEIGQYGKALNYATWHMGDDCFVMSVSRGEDHSFVLEVYLYSYTFQRDIANEDPPVTEMKEVICGWCWDGKSEDLTNSPDWQRRGNPEEFLNCLEIIKDYGPYGDESSEVDAIEREMWAAVEERFWKDGQPCTGTEMVLYNLHPNQKSEDKRNNNHSSLKPIKDDIVIETREITDRGREVLKLPRGIPSESLAKCLTVLYYHTTCCIVVQGKVVCSGGRYSLTSDELRHPVIYRSEAEVDLHKWLLIQGGSRIKIAPNQPLRSKGAPQGPGYDCFIGEVRPELGLAMSGIWFWVNQRLIPFADSQSLMRKNCKLASALQPQGNLDGCAVLILLNDIAVSDTKEKLTLEGAAPGSQEFWLSKALLPGGQVYKGIQKFAKQLEVELDDDEESKGMAPPARKQAKKSRKVAAGSTPARSSQVNTDDNASHSDTEQGSKMSTQSTAHKVNGPAANAAQGVDSVGHRGTPTKPVSTRKTSSRGQTGSTSGQQAQHMAPVQSQPGQPLQLAQPETPDTHVRTLGGGRPPRHSPAVAPEVHQQQGSPRSKEVQRPEIQGPAGDSNQQQPPLGNPRLSEPAVGSPQQTQKGQAQAVDVTPGLQQTQARAPSQSGASVDRHHASHAQQHSQDNNSVEAYYSAGSGVQPVISVMAPVTESNGSIEADLRGCTPDELNQLEQENRKIQQGGVPADETATDMGQCDEQDCDEVGMGNATSSQSGLSKLTEESFMDALLEVLRNDKPWHTFHLHPLLMLLTALGERPDDPDYAITLMKKLVPYDMESLRMAKGMASYPTWSHQGVVSPTWQYGSVSVSKYDPKEFMATIKGHLFNSEEQIAMALNGSIAKQEHFGLPVFQPTASDVKERMLEYYRRDQSSESFQVQTCRSSDIANVLRDHFASAELLLTFASNQCDEQALARDIHRAAPSPEAAKKQILRLPVYNMYRACERLKQAHDRLTAMASTQQPSTSANAAREKKQKPYTLDAMHEHFVLSTGRRFVTPLPEALGLRHTAGHDAAKELEVVLAIMWWLHQCKDTPAYQELAKEQMSEGAIQHGVEALRLKSLMMTCEFTAREKSRACAEKASPRQAAQTGSRLRDLLKMQSRDPTMPVYKSGMVVKGLEALQEWAK